MDFDPRWPDDRDEARRAESGRELSQGSRGGSLDPRERASLDPRDVFMKDLDLPRGPERERVRVSVLVGPICWALRRRGIDSAGAK